MHEWPWQLQYTLRRHRWVIGSKFVPLSCTHKRKIPSLNLHFSDRCNREAGRGMPELCPAEGCQHVNHTQCWESQILSSGDHIRQGQSSSQSCWRQPMVAPQHWPKAIIVWCRRKFWNTPRCSLLHAMIFLAGCGPAHLPPWLQEQHGWWMPDCCWPYCWSCW